MPFPLSQFRDSSPPFMEAWLGYPTGRRLCDRSRCAGRPLPQNDTASGGLQPLRRLLAPSASQASSSPTCPSRLFRGARRRPSANLEPDRIGPAKALTGHWAKGLSSLLDKQVLPWSP